ncbi:MAG: hypothetical protein ACREQ3_19835, partial [Candidatus Binatia bacterium]
MMLPRKMSVRKIVFASVLSALLLGGQPPASQAGCGCDKPPPVPAAVTPNVAFAGLPVALFHASFQMGQTWNVSFRQNGVTVAAVTTPVVSRRDVTDPTGGTYSPQLVVSVPNIAVGPTSIVVSSQSTPSKKGKGSKGKRPKAALSVPQESFTVMAKPVVVSEQEAEYEVTNYTTAVGHDGTLYMSVGGLNSVCKAME